jgi:poly-gamma-glutamate synthesis protein (capsule biosynthesis protein)
VAAAIPSESLASKLRLARALADAVVVTIHWGMELHDWPSPEQQRAARWLVDRGADLVVGHHPHVVQPARCVEGGTVFFSVGNHVFDQKYPDAKGGLVADCRLGSRGLRCGGLSTRAPVGSATPRLEGDAPEVAAALRGCACGARRPVEIGGVTLRGRSAGGSGTSLEGWRDGTRAWATAPGPLVAAAPFRLPVSEELALFTLERRPSPLDGEEAARPYVYRIGPRGPVALWRGSALAWPLVDAVVLPEDPGCICALHRADSFLAPDPSAAGRRTAAYRWNGFGFDAVEDPDVALRCAAVYAP